MAKTDLRALPLPERRVVARAFTDPLHPGVEFAFRLRGPHQPAKAEYRRQYAELLERHVTGSRERNIMAVPIAVPGRGALKVGREECSSLAGLLTAQDPESDAERYTLTELAEMLLVAPNAFAGADTLCWELFEQPYVTPEGNSAAAATTPL